jgi:predicted metal-dependent peptidase
MASLPPRILRARLRLMLGHPYLAAAVARLPLVDASDTGWCDTMATDGYNIYVSQAFCEGISDDELVGVFAHELVHCIAGHMDRRGSRGRELWNIATDYATNGMLVELGFSLPADALHDHLFAGLTAEEVYDRLRRRERGSALVRPLDRHLEPGDVEGLPHQGENFPSAEERRRLRRALSRELLGKLSGRAAGRLDSEIRAATETTVRWEQYLARFFAGIRRTDYRLFPPNRKHVWRGLFLPAVGVPGPEHLVVAVDTSGSMSDGLLARILAELDRLRGVTECRLTLIQCDAAIQHVQHFEPYEPTPWETGAGLRLRFRGRGGTDLRPPFDWVHKHHSDPTDALIYLTDGFGPMPAASPPLPVLWVMPRNGAVDPEFGSVVRIDCTEID